MSNPQLEAKAADVKTAEGPFNNLSADVIIRSSDLVDFYVRKIIVVEASPVFAGMFTIRIPEEASASQQDSAQTLENNVQLYRDGYPFLCAGV